MSSVQNQQETKTFKVILVGKSGVGKTRTLLKFTEEGLKGDFNPKCTIGVDFKAKTLYVNNNKQRVKLNIWDTAGTERYSAVCGTYYRGAQGVVLFYDVTDKASFETVPHWMEEIKTHCDNDGKDVCKILVGNKCDLTEQILVTKEEGDNKAKELGMEHIQCSAMTGKNVEKIFKMLAEDMLKKQGIPERRSAGFQINRQSQEILKKCGCN